MFLRSLSEGVARWHWFIELMSFIALCSWCHEVQERKILAHVMKRKTNKIFLSTSPNISLLKHVSIISTTFCACSSQLCVSLLHLTSSFICIVSCVFVDVCEDIWNHFYCVFALLQRRRAVALRESAEPPLLPLSIIHFSSSPSCLLYTLQKDSDFMVAWWAQSKCKDSRMVSKNTH